MIGNKFSNITRYEDLMKDFGRWVYVVSESGTKWAFEVTNTLEATTLLPGDSIIVLSFC